MAKVAVETEVKLALVGAAAAMAKAATTAVGGGGVWEEVKMAWVVWKVATMVVAWAVA